MAYPAQTITPRLGLSLIGQDEVIADNFSLIDAAFGGSVVNAVGISGGNTLGATGSSTGSVYFQGGNNITLSGTGSTIVIVGGAGGGGGNFSAGISGGNTLGNSGLVGSQIVFAGGNNVTLSGSTNAGGMSVTISGPNTVAQSVQTQGSVLINGSSGSVVITAGNNITLSQNASTITISAANQTVQTQNLVSINGSSGSIVFTAGANISLSQNASTITISASNQSVQTQNLHDVSLSGNTAGALALVSSGTLVLAGGNNITLSQNGQSVTVSGAASVTNSQYWLYNPEVNLVSSTFTTGIIGSLYLWPFQALGYLSGSQVNIFQQLSVSTSSNSSMAASMVFHFGIYTRNVSTLSSISSGAYSFSWTNTSNNSTSVLSGVRIAPIAMNINMSPGDYFLGVLINSTSGNSNGATLTAPWGGFGGNNFSGYLGTVANKSLQQLPGWGVLSVSTGALPGTVGLSDLSVNNVMRIPMVNLVNYTV